MPEYSTSSWDVFATRAFSWTNYLLAISYEMTEVVVDDKTGEILCVAHMGNAQDDCDVCFARHLVYSIRIEYVF